MRRRLTKTDTSRAEIKRSVKENIHVPALAPRRTILLKGGLRRFKGCETEVGSQFFDRQAKKSNFHMVGVRGHALNPALFYYKTNIGISVLSILQIQFQSDWPRILMLIDKYFT